MMDEKPPTGPPQGSNPLEQYILLAKSAHGAAAVGLVKQALEAPGVHVFGELLDMANIKELQESNSQYYEALQLFAYGTYSDYIREGGGAAGSRYPELTATMLTKLRHLTLASLATGQKNIALSSVGEQLGLASTRQLEDLIIEAIYADVVHGKLDQKNGILEVDYTIGRDIKPEDLTNIINTLQAWCDNCDTMLGSVDQLIVQANNNKEKHLKHRNDLEQTVQNMKTTLKAQQQSGGGGSGGNIMMDSDEMLSGDGREHEKKRPTKKGVRATSSKFWSKSS